MLNEEFDILNINGLTMWYERGAAILFRRQHVQKWPNHSTLNSIYDLDQSNFSNMPRVSTPDGTDYTFYGTQTLETSTQKDFFEFTVVVTLNLNETAGLTNEGLLGKGLNDLIKLYRGGSPTRVGYKLVGTNYDGNSMSTSYPSGDFVISFTRYPGGESIIRINTDVVETIQTDPADRLRYTQIGSGLLSGVGLDSVVYEIAIFDTDLSNDDLKNVEEYLLSRI